MGGSLSLPSRFLNTWHQDNRSHPPWVVSKLKSISLDDLRARQSAVLTDLQVEKSLDAVDRICLDALVPCVCRGDVQAVRAVLEAAATGGTEEERRNAVCGAPRTSTERPPASVDIRVAVARYANYVCPVSGRSVLFYAVIGQHVGVVEELLRWGADPSWRWNGSLIIPYSQKMIPVQVALDCLSVAIGLRDATLVKQLVEAGAEVNSDVWNTVYVVFGFPDSPVFIDIFELLFNEGRNAAPIPVAIKVIICLSLSNSTEHRLTDTVELLSRHGNVSWSYSWFTGGTSMPLLLRHKETHFLLRVQARSRREKVCRNLLMQNCLLYLCRFRKDHGNTSLVPVLLEEGASVHGWTWKRAAAMLKAWQELAVCGNDWESAVLDGEVPFAEGTQHPRPFLFFWASWPASGWCCRDTTQLLQQPGSRGGTPALADSEPFSEYAMLGVLPAVLSSWAEGNVARDFLLRKTNVAWLKHSRCIPTTRYGSRHGNKVHDGPTCYPLGHVTEEQSHVTLAMCTCSGGVLQSLQSTCRDVILTACMTSHSDLLSSAERLPLPPVMLDYLLCGP